MLSPWYSFKRSVSSDVLVESCSIFRHKLWAKEHTYRHPSGFRQSIWRISGGITGAGCACHWCSFITRPFKLSILSIGWWSEQNRQKNPQNNNNNNNNWNEMRFFLLINLCYLLIILTMLDHSVSMKCTSTVRAFLWITLLTCPWELQVLWISSPDKEPMFDILTTVVSGASILRIASFLPEMEMEDMARAFSLASSVCKSNY